MWLACVFVSVAFLVLCFVVVGNEKWLAVGVTVIGSVTLASTLETMCYWVVMHRNEANNIRSRRLERSSKWPSGSVSGGGSDVDCGGGEASKEAIVGNEKWLAVGVTVIGSVTLASTLGTMCYWVVMHRTEANNIRSRRLERSSKWPSGSVEKVMAVYIVSSGGGLDVDCGGGEASNEAIVGNEKWLAVGVTVIGSVTLASTLETMCYWVVMHRNEANNIRSRRLERSSKWPSGSVSGGGSDVDCGGGEASKEAIVGNEKWLAVGVTVIGSVTLASTLGTMCYWVVMHRTEANNIRSRRLERSSKWPSGSVEKVMAVYIVSSGGGLDVDCGGGEASNEAIVGNEKWLAVGVTVIGSVTLASTLETMCYWVVMHRNEANNIRSRRLERMVVVQTSIVVVEKQAKKQVMAVINKLMWLACVFVSVAFLALCFVVVGNEKWLAVGVTVIGSVTLASTLGTMCYWVVMHRTEANNIRSRRLERSSKWPSGSVSLSPISDSEDDDFKKLYAI
ncbi:hypothetical protein L1987_25383 [Smallanthus sonchifolius]|uniref:Uncharacterized protein n=1 Tax=Smallanthus sonchifolius TaxID=185202 RepID=A0ACB9IPJ0_9ASTR|nr:hypothetical protein L1987_25383 [Smallanthus sonchifolius]